MNKYFTNIEYIMMYFSGKTCSFSGRAVVSNSSERGFKPRRRHFWEPENLRNGLPLRVAKIEKIEK